MVQHTAILAMADQ